MFDALQRSCETLQANLAITARVSTTVLSETHAVQDGRRGLTLLLVLRRGLRLAECLGGTAVAGQTFFMRLTYEPEVSEQWQEHRGGVTLTRRSSVSEALCHLRHQLCWIPELSFLP